MCSGIEAASVAFNPLGWQCQFVAEIESFPCAVLAHHYPTVPNLGDMTRFKEWPDATLDVLCAGTPCQSFSNAGLRAGLDDPRGGLMLTFGAVAERYRPRWLLWENVPGVLSSNDGRDFGAFLGLLGFLGYGFAYRVLDAQYFGLAQRRKRVFVVACLGDWRSAAAVLFEPEGLRGDPAPRRAEGARAAVGTLGGTSTGGGWRIGADEAAAGHAVAVDYTNGLLGDDLSGTLKAAQAKNNRGHGVLAFDTTQMTSASNRSVPKVGDPCHPLAAHQHLPAIAFNARQDPISGPISGPIDTDGSTQAIAFGTKESAQDAGALSPPLRAMGSSKQHPNGGGQVGVAYSTKLHNTTSNQAGKVYEEYTVGLDANSPPPALLSAMQVRRLTPRECERLQGFPDDYTAITVRGKPAADGPRYKALGNSWAVPNVRWIGRRIEMVDAIRTRMAA
jgi:DNA (cytosine-5)-methyltransferase 1